MASVCAGARAVCGKARFQQRHRPLDDAEDQPFGSEGAAEHQRQFPGDIEQLIIGGRIVGRSHDPVIERRKVRQRPRHIGDLVRDLADLLGHRQQELCAKAVRRERNRGLRFGRGLARPAPAARHWRSRAACRSSARASCRPEAYRAPASPDRASAHRRCSWLVAAGLGRSAGLRKSREGKQGAGRAGSTGRVCATRRPL